MKLGKHKESVRKRFGSSNYVRWAILVGISLIFTVILYPSLIIHKHTYQLGDVAERDIKATKDFFIENKAATEANRKRAVDAVLTVYDHDKGLSSKLSKNIQATFDELRAVFETEKENRNIHSSDKPKTPSSNPVKKTESLQDRIWQMKTGFEEKIGISVSNGAYQILLKEKYPRKISDLINRILTEVMNNGVVSNKEILLREIDKGITLRTVGTKKETVVLKLKSFYGLDQAKTMVRIIGQPLLKDLNYTLLNLIVDFVQRLLQPNITLNRNQTEERKKSAAEIKPIMYKIKAGEMLLREGERVSQFQLQKLKSLQAHIEKGQIVLSSLGATMILVCLLLTTYVIYFNRQGHILRNHNKNLLFFASVVVTFFFLVKISASLSESIIQDTLFPISASSVFYGIPLASGAMIICLFMGLDIAIPIAIILAACAAVIFENKFEIFIYFMLNSVMGAFWVQNCRERKVFIKAGVKLGLLNVVLATAIDSYLANLVGLSLLWDWAFAFLGGIGAGVVTAGFVPLIEIAFRYTTDITLLELANLDQPILRRLMIEVPGTYHHSVIVGSMVEAAASQIRANPLLARVCGYYHDIGKIKTPLYFIENQTNGKNKHDKLAPSMSSLILIAHIKNGVEMARENKLGQIIIDTIRQHHGTSLIKFFYDKAKQMKGEDAVTIDDFRYPGPKPQTKEAGLVMLADVVEAASRTLDNPTPSRIQGLLQHLINRVFSDGQLDNCELTLKDLNNIAKSFNKILNGIHHHRIEYSEAGANGKGKNGSPDKQQAIQAQNTSGNDSEQGSNHLKRLGLS